MASGETHLKQLGAFDTEEIGFKCLICGWDWGVHSGLNCPKDEWAQQYANEDPHNVHFQRAQTYKLKKEPVASITVTELLSLINEFNQLE